MATKTKPKGLTQKQWWELAAHVADYPEAVVVAETGNVGEFAKAVAMKSDTLERMVVRDAWKITEAARIAKRQKIGVFAQR
ncbi:MAG: hypothetical protein AAF958_12935 [Planctomycetota bacterium]